MSEQSIDNKSRLSAGGMIIQTNAIILDAYREMNSKKLFWITMILSGLIVGMFAAVGFDEQGFSIFGKSFRNFFMNTRVLPKVELYKFIFINYGVKWWLSFFAIILALISTAPMFPDLFSGGAVDLYLARPLGRTRLFVTKYIVGLLFVSLQVAVFCLASFLVIGLRSGSWIPGLFLAVPVVVLIFSYLWGVCAFLGTVTRSTIASLLLTFLVWALISAVNATESTLLFFSTASRIEVQELGNDIVRYDNEAVELKTKPATTQKGTIEAAKLWTATKGAETARAELTKAHDPFESWHTLAYLVKYPLPKSSETSALLERWMDSQFRPPRERDNGRRPDDPDSHNFFQNSNTRRLTAIEYDRIIRSRSVAWVIGTSLAFEVAMIVLSAWIFARRDF